MIALLGLPRWLYLGAMPISARASWCGIVLRPARITGIWIMGTNLVSDPAQTEDVLYLLFSSSMQDHLGCLRQVDQLLRKDPHLMGLTYLSLLSGRAKILGPLSPREA